MKLDRILLDILDPITTAEGMHEVLVDLGRLPSDLSDVFPPSITEIISAADTAYEAIRTVLFGPDAANGLSLQSTYQIYGLAQDVWALIAELRSFTPSDIDPAPFDQPDFWTGLAQEIPGYLLRRWLKDADPVAYQFLDFAGLWQDAQDGHGINLAQINAYLTAPGVALLDLVTDDQGDPDIARLVALAQLVIGLLDLRPSSNKPLYLPYEKLDSREVNRSVAIPSRPFGITLKDPSLPEALAFDVDLHMVSARRAELALRLSAQEQLSLSLADGWTLGAGVTGDTGISFFADASTGIELAPDLPEAQGNLSLTGAPATPWRIFGADQGPALTLAEISVAAQANLSLDQAILSASFILRDLKLTVDMSESDGFLASLLPAETIEAEFGAELRWTSPGGFEVVQAGPPQITIPTAINFPGFRLSQINLDFASTDQEVELAATLAAAVDLGFMSAVVDNVGVTASLRDAANGTGVLGTQDIAVSFLPPNTIGVSFGSEDGPIHGGGLLHAHHAIGQYDAIMSLRIAKIGITAVTLVDTQTVEDGWSMFCALFIEFPGIMIGPGLTLDGLGGVAGINRTLEPQTLLDTVRSGELNTVLFPEDPIAEAPAVIDAFKSIYPPAADRYVFGIMAKMGFAKGLVTAELGLVVSVPSPVIIATLGTISVTVPRPPTAEEAASPPPLPADEEPPQPGAVVQLNLDFAGTLDLGEGTVAFDAFLRDSTIAGFEVTGGMSLRAAYKNDPYFLLALGGFHPGFPQPVGFPYVPRLGMGISIGGVVEIQMECYFAVASQTVQFGTALWLKADILIFSVEGGFQFDALFGFNPARIDFAIEMYVSVKALGIDLLAVRLSGVAQGPKPWVLNGRVEVSIIGYRDGFEVNYNNGVPANAVTQAAADVLEELVEALGRPDAWEVLAPDNSAVVLADQPGWLPNATVQFSQQVVPLETVVDRHGNNRNIIHDRFSLSLTLGQHSITDVAEEWFAPGQFSDIGATDQAKLSAPAFERRPGGLAITGGVQTRTARPIRMNHKVIPYDPALGLTERDVPAPPPINLDTRPGRDLVFSVGTLSDDIISAYAPEPPIFVHGPAYVSVDGAGLADFTSATRSYMEAAAMAEPDATLARDFELDIGGLP